MWFVTVTLPSDGTSCDYVCLTRNSIKKTILGAETEEDPIAFRQLERRAEWLMVLKACLVEMGNIRQRSR